MNDSSCKIMLILGSLLACSTASAAPASNALPTGESVVFGNASFDRSLVDQLTIKQTSTKLISNWDNFNIGSAATVNFVQPTINSRALNRVTGSAPTEIFGKLNANGQVFLVNPAGITFGRGSQVQTGTLLASVLDITNRNFINNDLIFERGTARGQVNNQGTLLAKEGNVTLLGPTVQNSGNIESSKGNIFLANGDKLAVFDHNIALQKASSMISLIRSTGNLTATRVETRKGQVMLLGEQANSRSKIELAGNINSQNAWGRAYDLYVTAALTSSGNTALESINRIYVNAPLTVSGNSALLSFKYRPYFTDGLTLAKNVKINMTGSTPYFRVNGELYKFIKSAEDLQAIGSNSTTLDGKYALLTDIDASMTANWNNGSGFMPIDGFSGKLNGLGHSISGLSINRPTMDAVGVFGHITYDGEVHNLNLNNASVRGQNEVGMLAGKNAGLINQVQVQGSVNGVDDTGGLVGYNFSDTYHTSSIYSSSSSGSVSGNDRVGGLVGNNSAAWEEYAEIYTSHASTTVQGNRHVGGLVGINYADGGTATISSSYATGNVKGENWVGGLVGSNIAYTMPDFDIFYYPGRASISRSYSTGKVSGLNKGGLIGMQSADDTSYAAAVNSYWNKDTAQLTTSAAGSALDNTSIKQQASYVDWNISNLPKGTSTWYIDEGVAAPVLR